MRIRRAAIVLAILAGCGGAKASPPHESAAKTEKTQLVVAIVFDHFPSWALDNYLEHLSEDGLIRQSIREGAYHPRALLPHAITLTAPGHTSIYTGVEAGRHGIAANAVWNRERGKTISSFDDSTHNTIGSDDFASPSALRVDTVADSLKRATGGKGKVVSVSLKDRASIPGGGRSPDAVYWYDKDIPGFTTSTFYVEDVPDWLVSWRNANPLSERIGPWLPNNPTLLKQLLGADDRPGEGNVGGFGTAFPHTARDSDRPYSVLRASPQGADYTLALARELVKRHELGRDDVPDLLAISISSTDYVGHIFGAGSWEYFDTLYKADLALGAFVRDLRSDSVVTTLITSDHGASPLPEENIKRGLKAGRVPRGQLTEDLKAAMSKRRPGNWVDRYEPPYVYLGAQADGDRAWAVGEVLSILSETPGIARAYDVRTAPSLRDSADEIDAAVGRSIAVDGPGDIYVLLDRYFVTDVTLAPGAGTNHGTPYDYDRHVPVLMSGPMVMIGHRGKETVDLRGVAPTLAFLLGVPSPKDSDAAVLPGVQRR